MVEKLPTILEKLLQVLRGDFFWLTLCVWLCICRYVTVLVELTRIEGTKHGRLIAAQMLDVAIRVQAVRAFVVVQMVSNLMTLIT